MSYMDDLGLIGTIDDEADETNIGTDSRTIESDDEVNIGVTYLLFPYYRSMWACRLQT